MDAQRYLQIFLINAANGGTFQHMMTTRIASLQMAVSAPPLQADPTRKSWSTNSVSRAAFCAMIFLHMAMQPLRNGVIPGADAIGRLTTSVAPQSVHPSPSCNTAGFLLSSQT